VSAANCKKVAPAATFSYSTVGSRDRQYAEFTSTTDGRLFAKEFRTSQEAIMRDALETNGARVLAWIKRRSWGNFCLYCVDDAGQPVFQADCATDLGLNAGSVSKIVSYYVARGHVARSGVAKILSPVVDPQIGPAPDVVDSDLAFQAFYENWKVSAGALFQEYEAAIATRKESDAIIRKIRKVIAGDYEKLHQAQQTEPVSLYKIPEDSSTAPTPTPTPIKRDERTNRVSLLVVTEATPEQTPVRSSAPFSIKELLRAWLVGKFPLPTGLGPDVLDEIAQHVPDENVFDQFCLATETAKPHTWRYFIKIAAACEANREQYAAAAGSAQVQRSPATNAALDLMRRRIARGEPPL
jgi:hypothetical protein